MKRGCSLIYINVYINSGRTKTAKAKDISDQEEKTPGKEMGRVLKGYGGWVGVPGTGGCSGTRLKHWI